nr:unnamed protein product [Digitaria exilis]
MTYGGSAKTATRRDNGKHQRRKRTDSVGSLPSREPRRRTRGGEKAARNSNQGGGFKLGFAAALKLGWRRKLGFGLRDKGVQAAAYKGQESSLRKGKRRGLGGVLLEDDATKKMTGRAHASEKEREKERKPAGPRRRAVSAHFRAVPVLVPRAEKAAQARHWARH